MTSDDADEPRAPHWTRRQMLAAVIVATAVGGVGGAAIYAATQGTPHAIAGGMRGPAHTPAPQILPPPAAQAPSVPAGVLHGEYVVPDSHGGVTTKIIQTGVVDELTLSQIVIRSDDGYTQIYPFRSASAVPDKSVAVKDTVTVEATRAGQTLTLTSIGEGQPPAAN